MAGTDRVNDKCKGMVNSKLEAEQNSVNVSHGSQNCMAAERTQDTLPLRGAEHLSAGAASAWLPLKPPDTAPGPPSRQPRGCQTKLRERPCRAHHAVGRSEVMGGSDFTDSAAASPAPAAFFTPRSMPYFMSPFAKARCIRSRQ